MDRHLAMETYVRVLKRIVLRRGEPDESWGKQRSPKR